MKFIQSNTKQQTTTSNEGDIQNVSLQNATIELIIPWIQLEIVYKSMEKNARAIGKVPDIIQQVESNYFKNLPTVMPPMDFISFQTSDVELLACGKLHIFTMTLVHPILHGLLDLLAIHQI